MEEPATAHVVADKLGLRCPAFDLKNARNGVLNALEVADAFIRAGQYRRVLVATAEVSTRLTYNQNNIVHGIRALPVTW
ncbi:hypothetical protein [Streptomyces phaeochromogenes]